MCGRKGLNVVESNLALKVKVPLFSFPSITSAAFSMSFSSFLVSFFQELEAEWWLCLNLCSAQVVILCWSKVVVQISEYIMDFLFWLEKYPPEPN